MEMMSAPSKFSAGGRHFRCQEQHDQNDHDLGGGGCIISVYNKKKKKKVLGNCKQGPNQYRNGNKFIMFYWDRVGKVESKFWSNCFQVGGEIKAAQFVLTGCSQQRVSCIRSSPTITPNNSSPLLSVLHQ